MPVAALPGVRKWRHRRSCPALKFFVGRVRIEYRPRADQEWFTQVAEVRRVAAERRNHGFETFNNVHPEGIRATDDLDFRAVAHGLLQAFLSSGPRLNESNH